MMIRKPKDQDFVRFSRTERQASIITAAASLFAVNGFKGTTTREIAKTAGISEALLFKYFPTKQALYAVCCMKFFVSRRIVLRKTPCSPMSESF